MYNNNFLFFQSKMVVAILEHVHRKQIMKQVIVIDVELIAIKWVGNLQNLAAIRFTMEIQIMVHHIAK